MNERGDSSLEPHSGAAASSGGAAESRDAGGGGPSPFEGRHGTTGPFAGGSTLGVGAVGSTGSWRAQPTPDEPPARPPLADRPAYGTSTSQAGPGAPPAPPVAYPNVAYPVGYAQYDRPPVPYRSGYGVPYLPPVTSGRATAVLVLGITALVMVMSCGIGGILGVIGLVVARGADREIAGSGGRLTGGGLVKGGRIMCWVSIALTVLLALAVGAMIVAGIVAGSGPDYSGSDAGCV